MYVIELKNEEEKRKVKGWKKGMGYQGLARIRRIKQLNNQWKAQ